MSTECSAGDTFVSCDNISVKKDSESDQKLNAEEIPQRPSSRDSPENSCAICLSSPENKSFTDSCFHTFCFSCLLEWSKVKAECPLCKQRFKSIVHNVRSFEDYDRYFVNNVTTTMTNVNSEFRLEIRPVTWGPDGYHTRTLQRFRFPTTLTRERRQHQAMERRLEALNWGATRRSQSISVTSTRSSPLPTTSVERRNLYDLNLWVRPSTIRYREASPEFYRNNPACTHRLIPWLNRELVALLDRNDGQVAFVMELVLALIIRYDVRSAEFLEHILPFFHSRTGHFIHEFYCFATSPYDMVAYDRTAVYETMDDALAHGFVQPSLVNPVEDRNREESVAAEPAPPSDLNQPGPSGLSSNAAVDVETDSDNSDCVLVNVIKPTRERTPVLISLVSSSDDEGGNASVPPAAPVPAEQRKRRKRSEKSEKKTKAARKSLTKPSVASRLRYICSDSETSSDEVADRRCGRTLTVTREGDVKLRIRSFVGSFSGGGSGDASGEDSSSRDRHRSHRGHHKKSKKHKHRHRRSSSE